MQKTNLWYQGVKVGGTNGRLGLTHTVLYTKQIANKNLGEGNGNPLQYSCLQNPMDRRVCQSTVQGVARDGHDLATKSPIRTYCIAQ